MKVVSVISCLSAKSFATGACLLSLVSATSAQVVDIAAPQPRENSEEAVQLDKLTGEGSQISPYTATSPRRSGRGAPRTVRLSGTIDF